jgi:SAM-dependent methyltransferase
MNKEFWDNRYDSEEFVFGVSPNVFFKSVIDRHSSGAVFIPGAGEGRDAVYAARKGWAATCLDISGSGERKCMKLASRFDVRVEYTTADISTANFPDGHFDAIASIYFHLPSELRKAFHSNAYRWLKPGGLFILEAFTPGQLKFQSGGPKDESLLVTAAMLKQELAEFGLLSISETIVHLNEGNGHVGRGSIVRTVAIK